MPSKPVKVYPIRGRFLMGVPTAVHVVKTRARADELIASGAFTDNPNDPERDRNAADFTAPATPEPPPTEGGIATVPAAPPDTVSTPDEPAREEE